MNTDTVDDLVADVFRWLMPLTHMATEVDEQVFGGVGNLRWLVTRTLLLWWIAIVDHVMTISALCTLCSLIH